MKKKEKKVFNIVNVIKLFFPLLLTKRLFKLECFYPGKFLQLSLIFVIKAQAYPSGVTPSWVGP
jgi:hypothetical protein